MSAALSHLTSRQGFERDRAQIRRLLLVMAGHVESMISASVRAFSTRDAELARHTIAVDAKVNRAECECDDLCLATLTAGGLSEADVRFVCLAMKMVVDLERIGDLAVNVCERAIDLAHEPPCRSYEDIHRMADLVKLMVRGAIDAFVNESAAAAEAVLLQDNSVDALYDRVFGDILEMMQSDAAAVHRGIHMQSVAKWLERMADHSENLAEQVIFMLEGKDVRHPGRLAGR